MLIPEFYKDNYNNFIYIAMKLLLLTAPKIKIIRVKIN